MVNRFYAHSRDGQPPETWQPLVAHLRDVAGKAADFVAAFNSADWAWNAGWLHDHGKASFRNPAETTGQFVFNPQPYRLRFFRKNRGR